VAEGVTVAVPPAKYPFQSGHVEVMGHRIHYVEHGTGAPVLFLELVVEAIRERTPAPAGAGRGTVVA
jgi:hypothetical protein